MSVTFQLCGNQIPNVHFTQHDTRSWWVSDLRE